MYYDKSEKTIFYKYNIILNFNISVTMAYTEFKFCFLILHTHSERIVSQVFHLGLSSHFMPKIGKLFVKLLNDIKKELRPKSKI